MAWRNVAVEACPAHQGTEEMEGVQEEASGEVGPGVECLPHSSWPLPLPQPSPAQAHAGEEEMGVVGVGGKWVELEAAEEAWRSCS